MWLTGNHPLESRGKQSKTIEPVEAIPYALWAGE